MYNNTIGKEFFTIFFQYAGDWKPCKVMAMILRSSWTSHHVLIHIIHPANSGSPGNRNSDSVVKARSGIGSELMSAGVFEWLCIIQFKKFPHPFLLS